MTLRADSDRLTALGLDRRVEWWRVDDEHRAGRTRPLPGEDGLLGITVNGTLVAVRGPLKAPGVAEHTARQHRS